MEDEASWEACKSENLNINDSFLFFFFFPFFFAYFTEVNTDTIMSILAKKEPTLW